MCGIPQVQQCIRQGNADGLSPLFLFLWLGGEVCYVIATLQEFGWVGWLLTNYVINIVCLAFIIRYKFWPRVP
jgi:hypothetical protein